MEAVIREERTRKGPWTEQEDLQLVCYVSLFGERRWDFIAKVSGLNRNGKSCRLRWVNYLHPGLKRCRITPPEERLILDLHSKWGNRWSRIARRLPGRTDNEIKNYWRTHTRKMAQERKRGASRSSSSSSWGSSCVASSRGKQLGVEEPAAAGKEKDEGYWSSLMAAGTGEDGEEAIKVFPMDQIWNEMVTSDSNCSTTDGLSFQQYCRDHEACSMPPPPSDPPPLAASPLWDYCAESLWKMEEGDDYEFNAESFYGAGY